MRQKKTKKHKKTRDTITFRLSNELSSDAINLINETYLKGMSGKFLNAALEAFVQLIKCDMIEDLSKEIIKRGIQENTVNILKMINIWKSYSIKSKSESEIDTNVDIEQSVPKVNNSEEEIYEGLMKNKNSKGQKGDDDFIVKLTKNISRISK